MGLDLLGRLRRRLVFPPGAVIWAHVQIVATLIAGGALSPPPRRRRW
jgi:hypothetical protein